ncbi:MgtC/SapB family protein [Gorillibacterium sp. sgz5001074]|uniref:MgtC/SapB family protein n=1 Tax=Gorillibacterium sp. sgz5001074 TaxID=3446695 RepID=UPI003F67FD75
MSPWELEPWYMAGRLLLALVLGGLIGFEREKNSSAAGFRTHILVCLGSALIMLLSAYGFPEFASEPNVRMDPARLAAQVISGIGFLGAGTILRNGMSITGLTTAASLWVVAAIGLSCGAGFYFAAILTTVMVLMSLWILSAVEKKFFRTKREYLIKVHTSQTHGVLNAISTLLEKKGVVIQRLALEEDDREDQSDLHITMALRIPKGMKVVTVVEEIRQMKYVSGVSVE